MNIQLLIVPYDAGRRDVRLGAGPTRLLAAGLETHLRSAGHSVSCQLLQVSSRRWLPEIGAAFDLAGTLATEVSAARRRGDFPLILAGNCLTALGTVAGLPARDTAVLWFDAHGDFNTPETTISGFLDGMALAALAGRCWAQMTRSISGFTPVPEAAICLLGARNLDDLEANALATSAVCHLGSQDVLRKLSPWLGASGRGHRAYVHIDLDVLDPSEGPVNEYAAPGGLTVGEVERAVGVIGQHLPLAAAAFTAYDPDRDPEGRICAAAFRLVDAVIVAAQLAAGQGRLTSA